MLWSKRRFDWFTWCWQQHKFSSIVKGWTIQWVYRALACVVRILASWHPTFGKSLFHLCHWTLGQQRERWQKICSFHRHYGNDFDHWTVALDLLWEKVGALRETFARELKEVAMLVVTTCRTPDNSPSSDGRGVWSTRDISSRAISEVKTQRLFFITCFRTRRSSRFSCVDTKHEKKVKASTVLWRTGFPVHPDVINKLLVWPDYFTLICRF